MQFVGRFGTLAGFACQICAAGAAVLWPNDKWIGWLLFVLGGALLVVTFVWWLRVNHAHIKDWIKRVEPVHVIIFGLAIALGGVIWLLYQKPATISSNASNSEKQSSQSQASTLLPDDGGPIKWNYGYLLGASGGAQGIRIPLLQVTGQNESDEFIQPISGFFRSEVTGREFPVQVNVNGILVSTEGYGIPARHQFNIGARLSDTGISATEFLQDFARLTFVFRYGKHTYTKHFTPTELEAEVSRTEKDLRPQPFIGQAGVRRIHKADDERENTN